MTHPIEGPDETPDVATEPDADEIRHALKQAGCGPPPPPPRVKTGHKVVLGIYFLVLVVLGAVYYALRLHVLSLPSRTEALVMRLDRGVMWIVLLIAAAKLVDVFLIARVDDAGSQYNLRRLKRLVVVVGIASIVVSLIFRNWYAALVSLGLISAILAFALQTPISSFIGWMYILVKAPYRVGDRIQIGGATGDVIAIGYLDTTLWEFGGPYLSTDHPSGRLIKFPNVNVLSTAVYNYSWPLFPYIWNEVDVQIAYGSDLQYVATTMRGVVEAEMGEKMVQRIQRFRGLLDQTPVDQIEVQEHPVVLFRVSTNTWVEAVVRYLVDPKKAGAVKSRLTRKVIEALNREPERVMFPRGDNR
ncbi:MAG TPA: mechanosensitive ion channel family protein [Longimicrobiaceae bacterium]|nr:mechanosensitive ion channel family protein [Longimicrobiaceae bacterium]